MEIGLFGTVPAVQKQLRRMLTEASARKPAEARRWLTDAPGRVGVLTLESAADLSLVVDLRHEAPAARLVVLLRDSDEASQLRAVQAGASGIASWQVGRDELLGLVHAAAESRIVVPLVVARRLAGPERAAGPMEFTSEDVACLRMFAAGMPMAEVARMLGVSESDAHARARSLYRHMGAQSRLQALVMAERLGFLDP